MVGSIKGHPLDATVAMRGTLGRREWGNPGARRGVIYRPDLSELWNLDEGARAVRVRPARSGEEFFESNGFYPFNPVPLSKLDPGQLEKRYPGFHLTKRVLSDESVGLHACDVIEIIRMNSERNGFSEIWYLARDLDGLVIRREVKSIVNGDWGEPLEWEELRDVRIGAEPDRFESPPGWNVSKEGTSPGTGSAAVPSTANVADQSRR